MSWYKRDETEPTEEELVLSERAFNLFSGVLGILICIILMIGVLAIGVNLFAWLVGGIASVFVTLKASGFGGLRG